MRLPSDAVTRDTSSSSHRSRAASFGGDADPGPDGHLLTENLDYPAHFPLARRFVRQWTLYVGPTNSGKTHAAMGHLRGATSGAYLGPLRLMALENADALNEAGVPCNLRTGEEHRECPGARHVASTIEMADLTQVVDVAVVDEAQILLDGHRGWAWTQALVGMPAGHLVLTGSPECEVVVQALADRLGEPLTVVHLERMSPLKAGDRPLKLRDLRPGDALVVFSRRSALDWRATLIDQGWTVATLYGALGPEVRRTEARRFRSGQAQILVATDAIGMGLNLPILRMVFAESQKFDGTMMRPLKANEWRQIGGRAGRYGLAEVGEATVLSLAPPEALTNLRRALTTTPKARSGAPPPFVWLPWSHLLMFDGCTRRPGLAPLLAHAYTHGLDPSAWLAPDLSALLPLAQALDQTALPLDVRYRYLGCPVDPQQDSLFGSVMGWAQRHGNHQQVRWAELASPHGGVSEGGLAQEERIATLASAYLWLAQRWPKVYVDAHRAAGRKARANTFIEQALAHAQERLCSGCGQAMTRRHQGTQCQSCRHPKRKSRQASSPEQWTRRGMDEMA
jgi:ATP-dependent RNA helicase SUPV3L1/SUV3